jgi:hypothetical protein
VLLVVLATHSPKSLSFQHYSNFPSPSDFVLPCHLKGNMRHTTAEHIWVDESTVDACTALATDSGQQWPAIQTGSSRAGGEKV